MKKHSGNMFRLKRSIQFSSLSVSLSKVMCFLFTFVFLSWESYSNKLKLHLWYLYRTGRINHNADRSSGNLSTHGIRHLLLISPYTNKFYLKKSNDAKAKYWDATAQQLTENKMFSFFSLSWLLVSYLTWATQFMTLIVHSCLDFTSLMPNIYMFLSHCTYNYYINTCIFDMLYENVLSVIDAVFMFTCI